MIDDELRRILATLDDGMREPGDAPAIEELKQRGYVRMYGIAWESAPTAIDQFLITPEGRAFLASE
jgi:hypothetical protein